MNITQSVVAERERALLGGDYANYHAQAVRRIHALRKRLGIATPRGRKYTPKAPVTAENIFKNGQWVQLLLATSERAWADAMTMKSFQSTENTQRPMAGSTKKQIVSRYRRAIAYATNLVDVLSDTTSQSTAADLLEAKAYLAILKGGLDFERSRWISCIQNYAVARVIYAALDHKTKTDVYKDLLTSTVDPSIKYAAYQSKLPRTKAVRDIAIENFPGSEENAKLHVEGLDPQAFQSTTEKVISTQSDVPSNLPTTITWRSRKVKIEDATISQALGTSQDKETVLTRSFKAYQAGEISLKDLATTYEEVIDARQEAVDVTKTAIDELRSQGVDQGDSRIQSLQVTRTAVNFAVIEWRIGRNRILCGSDDGLTFAALLPKQNSKPRKGGKLHESKDEGLGKKLARLRERTVLYDAILQSLDSIKELPGVVADADLVHEIEGKKGYFKALKCLAIGRSHSMNGQVANALALLSRASGFVGQATSSNTIESSTGSPTQLDVSPDQLKAVQEQVASLVMQYRGLAELEGLNKVTSPTEKVSIVPLIERFHLQQYDAEADPKNLVNFPPKLQPIPVKPLFFDLAWNYIHYPGSNQTPDPAVSESMPEAKKEEKPAKKGWFGFGR